jgi:Flp pilus assembly protein TadG
MILARLNSGPAREESGQVAALLAVFLVVLLGMAALAIDLGHAYTQRSLQASADAAALAGAQELPDGPAAITIAHQYSGTTSAKNSRANVPDVATSVSTKCLAVAPCAPVNVVSVTETVKVETRFARVLGIDTFDVRATSTACSPCATRPLDVMLVLDRTLSMCMDSWGNYQGSCPDLTNAKNGLRTFIG